jgi:tetratricopeptide (TPR) repeat protein
MMRRLAKVERTFKLRFVLLVLAFQLNSACGHRSADSYLKAGDEAMQNTHLADAESDYRQAIQIAPNDAQPHLALGSLYIFEHKPQQAQTELMKALELEPNNPKAHAALANAYTAQSQLGAAEAQGRAAVALATANAEYRMTLGTTLQNEQKLGAAEAEYRTAIGLEPRNAHAHLALASLLNSEQNRQAEAQAEFAQVRALDASLLPASIAAAPSPVSSPAASATVSAEKSAIRDTNRRFLLTHDSPVYDSTSGGARVVGQVHRNKYVRVTGLGGQWLRIQLRNGTIGFIPATAAE